MSILFTLCSNNYLAQAIVLGQSVNKHVGGAKFIIVLVDRKASQIDYSAIPFEVLPIEMVEPGIDALAYKYDIVELNTCVKPRTFEYLFETRNADRVIYLDPDTKIYADISEVHQLLGAANIVLTPHVLTPIPLDGKTPSENLFLMYGIYNLGFLALRKSDETVKMLAWWKERTYVAGHRRPDLGMFVDQLYMNLAPILFRDVAVLRSAGYNMAPWNLHERSLNLDGSTYRVNQVDRLVLFHFSSHRVDSGELPVRGYNRYSLSERPDLVHLLAEYDNELKSAGHSFYSAVACAYSEQRAKRLGRVGPIGECKIFSKRIALDILECLPSSFRQRLARTMANVARKLA